MLVLVSLFGAHAFPSIRRRWTNTRLNVGTTLTLDTNYFKSRCNGNIVMIEPVHLIAGLASEIPKEPARWTDSSVCPTEIGFEKRNVITIPSPQEAQTSPSTNNKNPTGPKNPTQSSPNPLHPQQPKSTKGHTPGTPSPHPDTPLNLPKSRGITQARRPQASPPPAPINYTPGGSH